MARRFARVNVTNAVRALENAQRAAELANEDLQIELARAGQEKMVELIERRGVGVQWARSHYAKDSDKSGSLRNSSFPGRVNTGNMRDSVGVRFERGRDRSVSAFGWIRNFEDYFGYQEEGFYHVKMAESPRNNRSRVPGMFALRDARRYVVKEVLPKLVRKYERRIARGVY